ncbi:hypothetical protein RvY_11959 [Ramazzottius varieornatus]|uniref:Uncharacterized protein n=1 Tax=Ramazzottius varieornatus TaxID=947166 RepID=A0A1D1VK93_RAMVA|nr:hypothetical protein RvY_11959 [Ramazzottius varieornatus]
MDVRKQRNIVVPNVMAQIISKLSGIPRQVQMNNFKTQTMAVGIFKMHRPLFEEPPSPARLPRMASPKHSTVSSWSPVTWKLSTLCAIFCKVQALAAYASKNDGRLPRNLLVFRGAVTHGQEVAIRTAEIPAIFRRLKEQGLDIALTYVVEYGVRSFEKVKTATDTAEGYSLVVCEESSARRPPPEFRSGSSPVRLAERPPLSVVQVGRANSQPKHNNSAKYTSASPSSRTYDRRGSITGQPLLKARSRMVRYQ